jgi:hypothetical protein
MRTKRTNESDRKTIASWKKFEDKYKNGGEKRHAGSNVKERQF